MCEGSMLMLFRSGCLVLAALTATALVVLLSCVPIPAAPALGRRGSERRSALALGSVFAMVEPLLRFIAGIVSLLPLGKLRAQQELQLKRAAYPMGLTPDEYGALCLLSGAGLGAVATGVVAYRHLSPWLIAAGLGLGFVLPRLHLRELTRQRAKEISRGLPHAIEICALCMGAGLDFPGSLRLVAGSGSRGALAREFRAILEELELGHTRREALQSFGERVPTTAVRDFVAAVVQAEQKGNPLAQVIQVQGRLLSQQRSVAAEEAAARAGVLMMGPMMLLVCAILALLLGPFFAKGIAF